MLDDIDYKNYEKLIYDEGNVTQSNVLKDFVQIIIKFIFIVFCIYFSIFFITGIIIKNLSTEKQILLEKLLSKIVLLQDHKV